MKLRPPARVYAKRTHDWYDPHKTLFWRVKGTVWPYCWKQCAIWSILATALCFWWNGVRNVYKKDPPMDRTVVSSIVAAGGEGTDGTFNPEEPQGPPLPMPQDWWKQRDKVIYHVFKDCEYAFTLYTGFLTFILGFFNSTVYSRWWQLRILCGTVMGRSVDTAVMFAANLRKGPGAAALRDDLQRLLALAHKVTYFHTSRRGLQLQELVDEGLVKIDSDEAAALTEANNAKVALYSVVYGWLLHRLNTALESEEVELDNRMFGTFTYAVQNNISSMRGSAADLMMYIDQPPPMGYTHLLEVMVYVYCYVACVGLVPKLLWLAPPVVFIVTFFFYGFYTVGIHMFDPFDEGECFGFDTDKFYESVRRNCYGVDSLVPASRVADSTRNMEFMEPRRAKTKA